MINVEIGNFRPVDKGSLRGSFHVMVKFSEEHIVVIYDCKYFVKGDKRWIKLPYKEIKSEEKTDYFQLIRFKPVDLSKQIESLILAQLEASNGAKNVESKPHVSSEELPF